MIKNALFVTVSHVLKTARYVGYDDIGANLVVARFKTKKGARNYRICSGTSLCLLIEDMLPCQSSFR